MPRKKSANTAWLPSIKVKPELLQALRERARDEDRSMSSVVRRLLAAAMRESGADVSAA